jgi:hypothetical protein
VVKTIDVFLSTPAFWSNHYSKKAVYNKFKHLQRLAPKSIDKLVPEGVENLLH